MLVLELLNTVRQRGKLRQSIKQAAWALEPAVNGSSLAHVNIINQSGFA
jgi:hypothetical protein